MFYELIEQPFEFLDTVLEEEAHQVVEMIIFQDSGSFNSLPPWVKNTVDDLQLVVDEICNREELPDLVLDNLYLINEQGQSAWSDWL